MKSGSSRLPTERLNLILKKKVASCITKPATIQTNAFFAFVLLTRGPLRDSGVHFTNTREVLMGSIIKKRRKKMRKHKHKKLRAKQRHKNK
jgi:hypothetical protein